QGGADDFELDTDPSLPDVEAARTSGPDASSQTLPESSAKSNGGEGDDPKSAQSKPEAGAPDASAPDGAAAGPAAKPTQGEVLITELMFDPVGSEPANEWFELHNKANGPRTLTGLTIVDGGDRTHVIGAGVTIAAGAYVVFVRDKSAALAAKIPAAAIAYEYGAGLSDSAGILLANGATGSLRLRNGATTIAQASYGGWFSQVSGSSIQLETLTYAAGSQSAQWCVSVHNWANGAQKGSPGAPSNCP
ncbi:MAG TPA: lamin tail domain-containing protein, partial [Labilithrix sp.]|nr:lamin tail domain-containing protein [Labilithrix sp.]